MSYDHLIARASSSSSRSTYDAKLDSQTRADLDAFVEFLQNEGKTEGTARSYRSHVSKALALPETKLTNDMKSAVRAFGRYLES